MEFVQKTRKNQRCFVAAYRTTFVINVVKIIKVKSHLKIKI